MEKREILFKGKEIGTDKWIEGFVVYHLSGRVDIWNVYEGDWFEVDPETVGQLQYIEKYKNYTIKVFTGDILNIWSAEKQDEKTECVVDNYGCITYDFGDYEITRLKWAIDMGYLFEIIGNIHDK